MRTMLVVTSILLAYCGGAMCYLFYIMVQGGSINEPDTGRAIAEMITAGLISLTGIAGIIFSIRRAK